MKTLHSPVLSAAIPTTVQAKLKSRCLANSGEANCIMCFSVPGRKGISRQVLCVVVKASRMVLVKNLVLAILVSCGFRLRSRFVLVALPVSLLQQPSEKDEETAARVTFQPPLPAEKVAALAAMGMGVHNKVRVHVYLRACICIFDGPLCFVAALLFSG